MLYFSALLLALVACLVFTFAGTGRERSMPRALVVTLTSAVATTLSVFAAVITGYLGAVFWFDNTRIDGFAAFLVIAIATGLFVSMVAAVVIGAHYYKISSLGPSLLSGAIWALVAAWITWQECREASITFQNFRTIMQSGDQRNYELGWIIRGWQALAFSCGTATLVAVGIRRWLKSE